MTQTSGGTSRSTDRFVQPAPSISAQSTVEEISGEAVERVASTTKVSYLLDDSGRPNFDVKFYAVNKNGDVGGAAIWSGAKFAVCRGGAEPELNDCSYLYRRA
jgi:hypothetical protein